jgi:serine/threonine protein kinase/tetratricopeptide (TPR) repeat protein
LDTGTRIGPYLVIGRLGSGGMGEVYRARDTTLDRDVAIKALPPNVRGDRARLTRFEREARLLASLNHPNIATLHGLQQHGDEPCLVMELVEGVSLEELIGNRPLSFQEAVRIGGQIAEALEAAHEKGIVHRDLKPSNVMVGPKGRAKVLDFGIAKSVDSPAPTIVPGLEAAPANPALTQMGMTLGTPPYMSPEQVCGEAVDSRTDIWAFGCLLYEMLSGKRAFQRSSPAATLEAVLSQEPDWRALPLETPTGLCLLLRRCLTKDVNLRIASIAEVRAELGRILEERPSVQLSIREDSVTIVEAPSLPMPPLAVPRPPRRGRIAAAFALVLVIASGGLLLLPDVRDFLGVSHADTPSKVSSLVVLPGRILGGEADLFLADAVPNTVSTHLAQIEGLETKVPPSNLEFERAGRDLQRIADAYQVGAVVLPTVTVAGDRLILNLQLVEIPSRVVLWTRDFEDRRDRYVELARAAAEGIRLALRPSSPALPRPADVVRTSEAELALHQGLFLSSLYRRTSLPEDFERALAALRRALELDPRQADAPAEIARLHAARVVTGVPPQEVVPEVRKWARRALEIDPRSSRAWAVLSEAEQIDPERSYQNMLDYALKAAAFGPDDGYAHNRLSYALSRHSILLGLEASERARQLDPLDLYSLVSDAIYLSAISRVDEALSSIEQVLRVEPEMPFALLMDALMETLAGHGAAAVELTARIEPMARDGRLRPEWLALVRDYAVFEKAARQGDRKLADAAAGRLLRAARGETRFPRWESATTLVVPLLARHGRTEEALDLLSFRDRLGLVETQEFLILNQDLEPLRGDPRFRTVLGVARKRFDEMLGTLSASRDRGEYPAYLDPALDDLLPLVGVPRPW